MAPYRGNSQYSAATVLLMSVANQTRPMAKLPQRPPAVKVRFHKQPRE
jgi:hypothetical protein